MRKQVTRDMSSAGVEEISIILIVRQLKSLINSNSNRATALSALSVHTEEEELAV